MGVFGSDAVREERAASELEIDDVSEQVVRDVHDRAADDLLRRHHGRPSVSSGSGDGGSRSV